MGLYERIVKFLVGEKLTDMPTEKPYEPSYPWSEYIKGNVGGKPLWDLLSTFDYEVEFTVSDTVREIKKGFIPLSDAREIFRKSLYSNLVKKFSAGYYTSDKVSTILSRADEYYYSKKKQLGEKVPNVLKEERCYADKDEVTGTDILEIAYIALVKASKDRSFISSRDLHLYPDLLGDRTLEYSKDLVYKGKDRDGNKCFRSIIPDGTLQILLR